MFYVYYLLDPQSQAILYIGRTNRPKVRKWAFERRTGLITCLGVLQRYSLFESACEAELRAIKKHRPPHNKLVTSGAGSYGKHYAISEKHKQAIRAATSRKPTKEAVMKRTEALRGRVFSQEHKDKLKQTWKPRLTMHGKRHSPETIAKMSAARKAHYAAKQLEVN